MKFISNLKIGVRLTIGFCIVIILMLALALLGYRNLVLVEGLLVDTLNIRAPISSFLISTDLPPIGANAQFACQFGLQQRPYEAEAQPDRNDD